MATKKKAGKKAGKKVPRKPWPKPPESKSKIKAPKKR